jgi:hypothetical protein
VAAAFLTSAGANAAEYYVVREQAPKACKVVETRSLAKETTWVQVGPAAFKARDEAEKLVTVICKEKYRSGVREASASGCRSGRPSTANPTLCPGCRGGRLKERL